MFPPTQQSSKATQWSRRLSRFSRSGQTVKAFCEQELISPFSFYYWRRRLQDQAAPGDQHGNGVATFVDLGSMAAPDAGIEPQTPSPITSPLTIRLELPGAIVLTISRGQ